MAGHPSLNGIAHRLERLEHAADEQEIRAVAERLSELTGAPADWLLKRAAEIAGDIDQHGHERTIELVAGDLGISAEQLETRAAVLAARGANG